MVVRTFLVATLLLMLVGCSGGAATSDTAAEQDSGAVPAQEAAEGAAEGDADSESAGGVGSGDGAGAAEGGENGEAQPDSPAAAPLPEAPIRTGERIIKEGTISLEVETGQFDRAFVGVISAARRFGGDVVGSSTRTGEQGDTFGSVTVRVPVSSFEDLVVGMGEIGVTRSRDIDAKDVTAEYTDLESRLRHLRAQEEFYLGLLERADTVRDAIAVQNQLDGIQGQIEQIQGRLNLLEDRTAFSTLTVELFEPGAGSSLLAEDEPGQRPSLAHYWDTARDAFVNVIGAMLVVGLFALPLLIAAGAVFAMWRVVRRPRRPASAAAEVEERPGVTIDG